MSRRSVGLGWPGVCALVPLALWWGWCAVSMIRSDWGWSPALPFLLSPAALALGVVAGGWLRGRADSPALPVSLLVFGVALVLGVVLVAEPGKEPLGYANANAALAVQVVALCGLALLAMPRRRRGFVVLGALLALAAVGLNRSAAGVAVAAPVAVVVLIAVLARPRSRWWAVPGVILAGAVSAGAARVILDLVGRDAFPQWAVRAFDPVREQLWHDAFTLWQRAPIAGSGPGSFAEATALSTDPDTMAAHSSILQLGSETGWIGVGLAGLLAVTCLLWASRGRGAEALIACAAVAALLVHSTVDHLLDFETVVGALGVVVGWGGAASPSEELDVAESQRPIAG